VNLIVIPIIIHIPVLIEDAGFDQSKNVIYCVAFNPNSQLLLNHASL
jgi:hypothetical protein